MKTEKTDFNQMYSMRKTFCRHGLSAGAIACLPIKYPVWYKIRVAELFANYKMYPAQIGPFHHFPELGLCITFIPFTHGLLGRYHATTSPEKRSHMQYWIHHKSPKRQEMICKISGL